MPTTAAPAAGSFDYAISDGNGGTDSASVTVNVTCDNDAPVAVDDTASGTEDMPVTINPADLVADDTDVDRGSADGHRRLERRWRPGCPRRGSITFTPDANLCASVTAGFDYAISDGNGGIDTGHVAVDLACDNDAPVAVDDTASGTEDMPVTIDPADLVADDTDIDRGSAVGHRRLERRWRPGCP